MPLRLFRFRLDEIVVQGVIDILVEVKVSHRQIEITLLVEPDHVVESVNNQQVKQHYVFLAATVEVGFHPVVGFAVHILAVG